VGSFLMEMSIGGWVGASFFFKFPVHVFEFDVVDRQQY
jgi:hypothetical protein